MNTAYKRQMARWRGPGRWARGSSAGRWATAAHKGAWQRGHPGLWATAAHKGAWSGLGAIKMSQPTALMAIGVGVGLYLLLKKK